MRTIRNVVFAFLAATILVGFATPAGAHGDAGRIEVVDGAGTAPLSITYTISVTYTDGDAPTAAVVAGEAANADGETVEAVSVAPGTEPGTYDVAFDYPSAGDWVITFRSINPAASLEMETTVGETGTEPTGPDTEAPDASSPEGPDAPGPTEAPPASPDTDTPATTTAAASPDTPQAAADGTGGNSDVAVLVGGTVLSTLIAGALAATARRGR